MKSKILFKAQDEAWTWITMGKYLTRKVFIDLNTKSIPLDIFCGCKFDYQPSKFTCDLYIDQVKKNQLWHNVREFHLTLIGKSWKIHPENFPKFQFSEVWHRPISGKLIQYFFKISISWRAWAGPISGKFIHQFFVSTYSVFVKYRGTSHTCQPYRRHCPTKRLDKTLSLDYHIKFLRLT